MPLRQFLDELPDVQRDIVIVNRRQPRPVASMMERLFHAQPVTIQDTALAAYEHDVVLLVEDGAIVATSSLDEFLNTILLVNSDLFITGTRELEEVTLPAVIESLENVPFHLRGYPEAEKEKFLLILLSRYIERLAWEAGAGTIRSSFQELGRIEDEIGTARVYRRLDGSDLAVHLYGLPGWIPPAESDFIIHTGFTDAFATYWFVVFVPEDECGSYAALVARETAPNTWDGFWTFEPSRVEAINRTIEAEM